MEGAQERPQVTRFHSYITIALRYSPSPTACAIKSFRYAHGRLDWSCPASPNPWFSLKQTGFLVTLRSVQYVGMFYTRPRGRRSRKLASSAYLGSYTTFYLEAYYVNLGRLHSPENEDAVKWDSSVSARGHIGLLSPRLSATPFKLHPAPMRWRYLTSSELSALRELCRGLGSRARQGAAPTGSLCNGSTDSVRHDSQGLKCGGKPGTQQSRISGKRQRLPRVC